MGMVFLLLLILGRAQDIKNTTDVDDRRILRQNEWVNCGRNKFPNGGRAFHCKTAKGNPSESWCRTYMKTTRGAIGMQYARLYSSRHGHCIIYFDKSVQSCPRGVDWYQSHSKGHDFDRDGTCSSDRSDNAWPWVYEYKRNICDDTSNGHCDSYGDCCDEYHDHKYWCGGYDTRHFKSNEMCCACGGGKKKY